MSELSIFVTGFVLGNATILGALAAHSAVSEIRDPYCFDPDPFEEH